MRRVIAFAARPTFPEGDAALVAAVNQIDRSEAERIVDTFKTCSKTWKLLLIRSVTQGADEISDKSAQCISQQVSDDTARTIFVGEIDRAYDDPSQPNAQPYPQLVEHLVAAFEKCLTQQSSRKWIGTDHVAIAQMCGSGVRALNHDKLFQVSSQSAP